MNEQDDCALKEIKQDGVTVTESRWWATLVGGGDLSSDLKPEELVI
jgi:hypothetical protein